MQCGPIFYKGRCEAKLEIPEGCGRRVSVQTKNLQFGGMDFFWNKHINFIVYASTRNTARFSAVRWLMFVSCKQICLHASAWQNPCFFKQGHCSIDEPSPNNLAFCWFSALCSINTKPNILLSSYHYVCVFDLQMESLKTLLQMGLTEKMCFSIR